MRTCPAKTVIRLLNAWSGYALRRTQRWYVRTSTTVRPVRRLATILTFLTAPRLLVMPPNVIRTLRRLPVWT